LSCKLKTIFIAWQCPPEGWIKLNCDGAYKRSINLVGHGDLLRDSDGRWLKGYARKIGMCDTLHVEMWRMFFGIDLTRRQRVNHLILENNFIVLVDILSGRSTTIDAPSMLVCRIYELMGLDWHIQIKHTELHMRRLDCTL
jgi:hypothetical protein